MHKKAANLVLFIEFDRILAGNLVPIQFCALKTQPLQLETSLPSLKSQ